MIVLNDCCRFLNNRSSATHRCTPANLLPSFIGLTPSFIKTNGFDGIDIDWESNINTTQYVNFISKLRAVQPGKLITIDVGDWGGLPTAASQSYTKLDQLNVGPQAIHEIVKWGKAQGYGGFMAFALSFEYMSSATGDARYPLSTVVANEVATAQ